MKRILVITGSARPHSVNEVVTGVVMEMLSQRADVEAVKADLGQINLPYMNAALPPSHAEYTIEDKTALAWQRMVDEADGVVFVVPEYNHGLSALQKNAIDWLYKEWNQKPAAFVGYGAYAAKHSYAHFLEINSVIRLQLGETPTTIQLGEMVDWNGTIKDKDRMTSQIQATLDELIAAL